MKNIAVEFFKWCNEPVYKPKDCITAQQRVIAQQPECNSFIIIDGNNNNVLPRGVYLSTEELYNYWLENTSNVFQTIDDKIYQLQKITENFPFIEYYSHTDCDMYKIKNEYTKYKSEKIVLCAVEDGFEKAIDMAIEVLKEKKKYFTTNKRESSRF